MYDDSFGSESLRRREGLRYYATCNITADASLADYGICIPGQSSMDF